MDGLDGSGIEVVGDDGADAGSDFLCEANRAQAWRNELALVRGSRRSR